MIKQFFKCDCKGRHFILIHKRLTVFSFLKERFIYIHNLVFTFFINPSDLFLNRNRNFAKLFKQSSNNGTI